MQGVGYRIQHYPRAAKHASPLTDRTGQTGFAAYQTARIFTFGKNLLFSVF
jgi:hypothetical protein